MPERGHWERVEATYVLSDLTHENLLQEPPAFRSTPRDLGIQVLNKYGKGSISPAPEWLMLSSPALALPHANELYMGKKSTSTIFSHQDLKVCLWEQVMFPLNVLNFHKTTLILSNGLTRMKVQGAIWRTDIYKFSVVAAEFSVS